MARQRRVKGSGSVHYDEARKLWVGTYELPRGEGGKRRRGKVYGKTAKEAQAALNAIRNRKVPPNKQTVAQYLTWYCDVYLAGEVESGLVNPRSVKGYRQNLLGHIAPLIGHIRLSELSAEDLVDMRRRLAKRKSARGTPLAPSTQAVAYAALRNALEVARMHKRIEDNWAKSVRGPRRPRNRADALTVEEAEAYLAVAAERRLYALYAVLLALGLRIAEVLGLQWSDLDLDSPRPTITIRHQLIREDGRWKLDPLKWRDDGEERRARLPAFTITPLKAHRERQRFERRKAGADWWDELDLVFREPRGTPVWPDTVRRQLTTMCKHAGITRRTPHDLRHSAATFLLAKKVDLAIVMEILGWRTSKVAVEIYAHAMDAGRDEGAEAMDGLFGKD